MESRVAQELIEINGGDGDDQVQEFPPPTLKELLGASATVKWFISTINELFACQLELYLGKMSYHARAEYSKTLQDTHLTDYFCCG